MSRTPFTLGEVFGILRAHHGLPEPIPTAEPFELILWENVAYLASPARRREAFLRLRSTIGTSPPAIMSADQGTLEGITAGGILKSTFADKLRECACIAIEEFGGDLSEAVQRPLAEARKALRLFPGIGEPGAEKVLLFCGRQALLAPESNGLRVLVRLGLVQEGKSYSRTYANSRAIAKEVPAKVGVLQKLHLLLQEHGRTLCKSSRPKCEACPLERQCAHARRQSGRG